MIKFWYSHDNKIDLNQRCNANNWTIFAKLYIKNKNIFKMLNLYQWILNMSAGSVSGILMSSGAFKKIDNRSTGLKLSNKEKRTTKV